MQNNKYKVGSSVEFLGFRGDFRQIDSGMLLMIYLPEEEIKKWAGIVEDVIAQGSIHHKSLEKLIGNCRFPKRPSWGVLVVR